METCESAGACRDPMLADMPPEVLSGILAWLPAPAVGACLAASRAFDVLSRSAAARYDAERIAQGAAGRCPCSHLCPSTTTTGQVRASRGAQAGLSARIVGHARECLPDAFSAAAAAGRLDVVRAIYRHAVLLWYGDPKTACCIDPLGPDPARALIDVVRSSARGNARCRPKPCATCDAFLVWMFRCEQYTDPFVGAFPTALAAGHTSTAVWVGVVGSSSCLLQALDAASNILDCDGRARAESAKGVSQCETNAATTPGDDERDIPCTDNEGSNMVHSTEDAVDDVVLACMWHKCPGAEARFLKDAAASGNLDALRRVARVRRHIATVFGETQAGAFPAGLDDAIHTATEWRTPQTTLAWLWNTFGLVSDRLMCRDVAKVAPACGLFDLGVDALCAFRRHTAILISARLARGPHAPVYGHMLAGCDPDGLAYGDDDNLCEFLDDIDDEPATAKVPCAIVARSLRSGCAATIDAALNRWRQCRACATFGTFECLCFKHRHINKHERAKFQAGMIHVAEAHPRLLPTYETLDAIMHSPRADSLIDCVASHSWNATPRDVTLWIKRAASNGCAAPIVFLLGMHNVSYDVREVIDTGPALVAAAVAGHLDVAALLLKQPTQKPPRKSDHDVMLAIEGVVKSRPRAALAWVMQHVDPRLYDSLWMAAAMSGDVDLVMDMARETQSPETPLKRPRSFVPFASMAVAHGHVACASALMDLDATYSRCRRHGMGAEACDCPSGVASDRDDAEPTRRAKRHRVEARCKGSTDRPRPMLAPSYVVDALGRGHTHAIDWASSGPFRIPWSHTLILTALDRIPDPARLVAVLSWALQSHATREQPLVRDGVRAWAERALVSCDPVRVGSVFEHCPWRDWAMAVVSIAKAMCRCPVAMWRTIDRRHPGMLDDRCFADSIVASGRVDLAAWLADERRLNNGVAFEIDHVMMANKAGNAAMAAWLSMRLARRDTNAHKAQTQDRHEIPNKQT
nr:hypothetical protein [Pandoravirus massiliensis]